MSGIWTPDGTRSLVPLDRGSMAAVISNKSTDSTTVELLSFPSLSDNGDDVRGQLITSNRATTANFKGATAIYAPAGTRKSYVTFNFDAGHNVQVYSQTNAAVTFYDGSLVWFFPANNGHLVRHYGNYVSYDKKFAGTPGIDGDVSNHLGDQFVFQAENGSPSTFYGTFHYLLTSSISNGASDYTAPCKYYAGDTYGINHGCIGGVYVNRYDSSRTTKALVDMIDDINNGNTPFCCKRITGPGLPQSCPDNGSYKAYLRYDMRSKVPSLYYHYFLVPGVALDVSGFTYKSSYPNARLTVQLEYSALIYRVPEGGWIRDNDAILPNTVTATIALNPSETPFVIMSSAGYQLVAIVTVSSAKIGIRPYSSTANGFTIETCRVERYQDGGNVSAEAWAVTTTDTNKTATYSSPYEMFTFNQYVLQNTVKCNVEVTLKIKTSGNKTIYIKIWINKTSTCTLKINMSTVME